MRAFKVRRGADLWVHSDAPPGLGPGLVLDAGGGADRRDERVAGPPLTAYDVAELAYRIERVDLGLAGGRQDQYAAAFGGFNFIEFDADATVVNPLRIRPDVLQRARVPAAAVLHGADARSSERIIERQTASYRAGKPSVVHALHRLKARDARDEEGAAARQGGRARRAAARGVGVEEAARQRHLEPARGPALPAGAAGGGDRRQDARARAAAATSCCSRASTASTASRRCSRSTAARWCRSSSSAAGS